MSYSNLHKDELLAEVDKRKAAGRELGVDSSSTKADIIASLEIDDDDAADHIDKAENNLPEGVKNDLPDGPSDSMPSNSEFSGRYTMKGSDEEFALAVMENDPRGRTHKLKNKVHFWEGSEQEFRLNFDKK